MKFSNLIVRIGGVAMLCSALGACSFYDSVRPRWEESSAPHCHHHDGEAPQGSPTYAKAFRQAPGDIRLSREQHLIPYDQQIHEANIRCQDEMKRPHHPHHPHRG